MNLCENCGRKLTRQYRMCKKCAFATYPLNLFINKGEKNYVLEEE